MANEMLQKKTLDQIIKEQSGPSRDPSPPSRCVTPGHGLSPPGSPSAALMAISPFAKLASRPPRPPPVYDPMDFSSAPSPAPKDIIVQMARKANIDLSGRLTPPAREFLKKHGICFYCRKDVHLSAACPVRTQPKRPRSDDLADQLRWAVRMHRQHQQQQQQ